MSLVSPRSTLDFHLSRPLTCYRDMSQVPLKTFIKKFRSCLSKADKVAPETEALWFYGLNHCLAIIQRKYDRFEPMDEEDVNFVDDYYNILSEKAVRAFYYLVAICVREVRHNKSSIDDLEKMIELFGEDTAKWFSKIENEKQILERFTKEPPDTSLGHFFECIRWQFYNSVWLQGYGGKAWGNVTDCLLRFIKGETSAEIMLDTVWTLSHNNGPIFNKGHFYSQYGKALPRILDIQRSGQIPEAILYDSVIVSFYNTELLVRIAKFITHNPDHIGEYVDWYKVEALGTLHSYPQEKGEQLAKYGMTESNKQYLSQAEKQKQMAEQQKIQAQIEFEKTHYTIMPGIHVKKFERAA